MSEEGSGFLSRGLNVMLGLLAVASIIFSAGLNWSRINTLEQRLDEVNQRQDRIEQGMVNLSIIVTDQRVDVRVMLQKLDTLQQDITGMKQQFATAFK